MSFAAIRAAADALLEVDLLREMEEGNESVRRTVAVITGASGGIGEAIADRSWPATACGCCWRAGAAEKLELVAERARDLSPGVETFAADLAEDESVRALADARSGLRTAWTC